MIKEHEIADTLTEELVENENIPLYEKEWDGIVNGNYEKIGKAVMTRYADDIVVFVSDEDEAEKVLSDITRIIIKKTKIY